MENQKLKLLRDLVLGDGSLYTPNSKNAGSTLGISHSFSQGGFLEWKRQKLEEVGFHTRTYQDKGGRQAYRLRTQCLNELRDLWQVWYMPVDYSKGGYEKNYEELLKIPYDEQTVALFFLDNGSRGIKREYKDYNTGIRHEVIPYIERFKISIGRRPAAPIIKMFSDLGIETTVSREGTGNGEVVVGKAESKNLLKNIVLRFCEEHRLDSIFKYKYDFPLSMVRAKRLNELDRSQMAVCDSLISTNN